MIKNNREIGFFILNGIVSVLINFLVYYALVVYDISETSLASVVGYISGMAYGFFANRKWTFQDKRLITTKVVLSYIFLYLSTLFVNVFVNALMLIILFEINGYIVISIFIAISISTILNYLGMKYFVFIKNKSDFCV